MLACRQEREKKSLWYRKYELLIHVTKKSLVLPKKGTKSKRKNVWLMCYILYVKNVYPIYETIRKQLKWILSRDVTINPFVYYRVCHGFRLTKGDDYFRVNFDHF